MEIINKVYFDDETGEKVAERFFVNSVEISEEDYYDMFENEEDDYEEDFEESNCECDEDFEDCETCEDFYEMIDEYVEMIQETDGCPDCIREILVEMAKEFIDEFSFEEEE